MTAWISPRIWRCPQSRFNEDEPLHAERVYTDAVLADIRASGFDAIWLRGRLRELVDSTVFPELNDPQSARRRDSVRTVIERGRSAGVGVHLYFNEPLAVPVDHPFWRIHGDVRGEHHVIPKLQDPCYALCTSTEPVRAFFAESIDAMFAALTGLGGVILITASEFHTHCWSHRALRKLGDAYLDAGATAMACPRCREREPADVVVDLLSLWNDAATKHTPRPSVWAWNWSWSMWYAEPQREIIDRLPDGVELMADFERGGTRQQQIGEVFIDEYSLGFVGPADRFVGSKRAADASGRGVCAKLQIGTTHELATVPNLPLVGNLFEKLRYIDQAGIGGLMCSWNFGNSLTVNTSAIDLFVCEPRLRDDKDAFLAELARRWFGRVAVDDVLAAWRAFADAFHEYPFCIPMLYTSPMNYAVAYPLTWACADRAMGPAWIWHEPWGDRLEDCLGPFTLDQVCQCWSAMDTLWREGLDRYRKGLAGCESPHAPSELRCAEMIGCHVQAIRTIFAFHRHRRRRMAELGLTGACTVPADDTGRKLTDDHIAVCRRALDLAKRDDRFGYHQEPGVYFYDPPRIEHAIDVMRGSTGKSLS